MKYQQIWCFRLIVVVAPQQCYCTSIRTIVLHCDLHCIVLLSVRSKTLSNHVLHVQSVAQPTGGGGGEGPGPHQNLATEFLQTIKSMKHVQLTEK